MALVDTTWYANSVAYAAVTARPQNTAVVAGAIRRQFTAPSVGNERCFICIVAGTTANVTDATWVLTRGAKTTDGTATWQECTGQAALNGDLTNTTTWAAVKAATPAVLGQIIKRSSGASYQICTTAGAMSASEPAFSDTAGVTTTDTTAVWTSLGAVGSYTGGMAPFARLASASAWFAAGNTVFVSSNHAESQTTLITINPTSSTSTVGKILCHNVSGSYPPASGDLTTGATISTTSAANIIVTSSAAGALYFYGLTFRSAVGSSSSPGSININSSTCWLHFDRCSFELATTNASVALNVGGTNPGVVIFNNTTVKFANVSQILAAGGQFLWQNTGSVLVSGSVVPTSLIVANTSMFATVVMEALDLSQITGQINASSGTTQMGHFIVRDCKLHASATIVTPQGYGVYFQLARSSA